MPKIASALAAALLACTIGGQAQAQPAAPQGPGQSMLVLDASGSMWGQIGGKPKIEIAREAVASMLQSWPASQQLGLMVYGHRSKGNCADIEMLKAPGSVEKAGFQQAVNALQPKGMTPISASVRMAAEQLKFSERKATVILVSDGEETCHADPCALGKELEKLGVDFTAHVVGFDIDKNPKAKAQLQCLASSTGGRYLDAKDAGELNRALQSVASSPRSERQNKPPETAGQIYDTTFGRMTIERWDQGRMAGRYAGTASDGADAGRIEGTVTQDPSDGSASFKGIWSAKTAEQRCDIQKDGTHYWGAATLLFDRERTQFQGYWDYCDRGGAVEGAWHGQLIGREPASAAK